MKNKDGDAARKAKVTDEHLEEARLLRELWASRNRTLATAGKEKLTQAGVGHDFGIGNQSAVGQFLRGEAPLSLKAATGFARALKCEVSRFSPRLAAKALAYADLAPARPGALVDIPSLLELRPLEAQLVMLFRGIADEDQKHRLVRIANDMYVVEHPEQSDANPFPATSTPTRLKAEHER